MESKRKNWIEYSRIKALYTSLHFHIPKWLRLPRLWCVAWDLASPADIIRRASRVPPRGEGYLGPYSAVRKKKAGKNNRRAKRAEQYSREGPRRHPFPLPSQPFGWLRSPNFYAVSLRFFYHFFPTAEPSSRLYCAAGWTTFSFPQPLGLICNEPKNRRALGTRMAEPRLSQRPGKDEDG